MSKTGVATTPIAEPVRKLEVYETILQTQCINLSALLHVGPVKMGRETLVGALSRAWDDTRREHPYTSLSVRDSAFWPANPKTITLSVLDGEMDKSLAWEDALVAFGNRKRPYDESTAWLGVRFLGVHPHESPEPAEEGSQMFDLQIFLNLCHAAADAPGATAVMNSLLEGLATYVADNQEEVKREVVPRTLINGIALLDANRIDGAEPTAPTSATACAILAPPAADSPMGAVEAQQIQAVHIELDSETTSALLRRVKLSDKQLSFQAILSAAALIATYLTGPSRGQSVEATTLLAVQIRAMLQPPATARDIVVGGSGVWVSTQLEEGLPVLKVAQDLHKTITQRLEADAPYAFFKMFSGEYPWPAAAIFASNVGVNMCMGRYGEKVRVGRFVVMGGQNEWARPSAGMSVHAHTFDGRLCLAVGHVTPAISRAFAQRFAAIIESVLRYFAVGQDNNWTIQSISVEHR